MHARLTIADELADAMLDAPDLCAQCGAVLADDEPYLCDDCTGAAYADWRYDDPEPWSERFPEPWIPRTLDYWMPVLLLASLLAAVIAGAGASQAHAHSRAAQRAINGQVYTWTLPGDACALVAAYEDGSATAWCADGLHVYDPDGAASPT
ncbi:MAG: hypothetical protein E6Q97_19385 [Desulfurellales bacterium]|nr:MAG: hypothetical protein E6Q97_19385 [Desulfurellales bacterium]